MTNRHKLGAAAAAALLVGWQAPDDPTDPARRWPDHELPRVVTYPPEDRMLAEAVNAAADAWNETAGRQLLQARPARADDPGACAEGPRRLLSTAVEMLPERCNGGEWDDPTEFALTRPGRRGATMVTASIEIPANRDWSAYDGPWNAQTPDIRRTVLHELGHVLGLPHAPRDDGVPTEAVMDADEWVNFTTLQPVDIKMIDELYGSPER